MKSIKQVSYHNNTRPNFDFELLRLEELLSRGIDNELTRVHKIGFYQIIIVTTGKGCHTIDFTDFSYQKGSLLTIRKDQVHKFSIRPSVKGYTLLFTEDFLTSQYGEAEVLRSFQLFNELLTTPKIDLDDELFAEFIAIIKNIESEYNDQDDEFSGSIIRSALHILLIKILRVKTTKGNGLVERKSLKEFLQFQKLVQENCFKTRKAIDYARMMTCTTKTLNNICRAILDKSVKTVIDDITLTRIKRLLLNTTLSVTEIAYTAGFDEPSNMYKYFKKHTKTSPEVFRQINK